MSDDPKAALPDQEPQKFSLADAKVLGCMVLAIALVVAFVVALVVAYRAWGLWGDAFLLVLVFLVVCYFIGKNTPEDESGVF